MKFIDFCDKKFLHLLMMLILINVKNNKKIRKFHKIHNMQFMDNEKIYNNEIKNY